MNTAIKRQMKVLVIPDGVIDGFCYPFSMKLLKELKELIKEDKVFEKGIESAKKSEMNNSNSTLSPIATAIVSHLDAQINLGWGKIINALPTEIDKLADTAEKFLDIF